MSIVRERTPESISVSADWLNQRAAIFHRNGQPLSAQACEKKAHRLFQEAKELRNKLIEEGKTKASEELPLVAA